MNFIKNILKLFVFCSGFALGMVNNGLLDQKQEALAFLGSNEVIQFGQNDIVPAGSSLIMAKIALPFGGSGANKDKVVTIYFSFNTEKGGNIFNQLNEHIDARQTKILTEGRELSISDLFLEDLGEPKPITDGMLARIANRLVLPNGVSECALKVEIGNISFDKRNGDIQPRCTDLVDILRAIKKEPINEITQEYLNRYSIRTPSVSIWERSEI